MGTAKVIASGRSLFGRASPPALLVVGLLCMTGCLVDSTPPPGGDPGNRHLHELSADPVFASLPPGAVVSGPLKLTPARYRAPAFEGAGWDGPAVTLTFTSAQPPESVFAYYQAQAAAAGWSPVNRNANGYPQSWTKTYPDGVLASLGFGPTQRGSTTYELSAGA